MEKELDGVHFQDIYTSLKRNKSYIDILAADRDHN